ncbi:hypothetical protein VTI74DRAFT_9005 [Chaetomium olivicolor]
MDDKQTEVQSLIRIIQVPAISKPILQAICAVNGLPKTGNKIDLQRRIIQQINSCADKHDWERLKEIRESLVARAPIYAAQFQSQPQPQSQPQSQATSGLHSQPLPQPSYYQPPGTQTTSNYAMPSYNSQGYGALNGLRSNAYQPPQPPSLGRARPAVGLNPPIITYKSSPFYEQKYQVGDVKTLEVMAAHRNSERIAIRVQDHPALQLCVSDPTMRVMVFCAAANAGTQDVAFPHQCELKVNGGDIKANLRGLKNKPGSTRPVDITNSLRLRPPSYINNVDFTYALTQKKFYLSLIVCKAVPIDTLVTQIQKKIRKESVIAEITKKASDPDVVAMSQNLSLKCPLSYMRLKRPCRGLSCNHIQCFDATSYLQLQEQGPQWLCPICNKPAPFDQLAIDEYAREILTQTPESVEQVTIEPDGKWRMPGAKKEATPTQESNVVDDDDLVISEVIQAGTRSTATPSLTSAATPHLATPTSVVSVSRDTSTAPRSSNKRPVAEVIDLTLSDDDDGPPLAKRVNYGTNGYSGVSY